MVKNTEGERQSLWSFLWHPYQKLWNWNLLALAERYSPSRSAYEVFERTIIALDTVALLVRVVARRIRYSGAFALFSRATVPSGRQVIYLDLGTHRQGRELGIVVDRILPGLCNEFIAFGFEARRTSYEKAASTFLGRANVRIVHLAVTYHVPPDGQVLLFKHPLGGIGDSLYNPEGEGEAGPGARLSDWLAEHRLDVRQAICFLRMNIEGAELDVITDLVESGLACHIDGYYGLWDDVLRCAPGREHVLRSLLQAHEIRPITFNGRDLQSAARLWCIEYDFRTMVLRSTRDPLVHAAY